MKITYEELNAKLIKIMADIAEVSQAVGRNVEVGYHMAFKANDTFKDGVDTPYLDVTMAEPNDWCDTYQCVFCNLDKIPNFDFPALNESAKEKEWREMWEDEMRADCIEDCEEEPEEEEDEEEDDA